MGSRARRTREGWVEIPPDFCPAGHRLGPGRVLVGWQACTAVGGGHRTHECRECGAVTYDPPIGHECDHTAFDNRKIAR